jgi:hypothetical protein
MAKIEYVEVGYKTDEDTFLVGDRMAEIGADILEEIGVLGSVCKV